MLRKAVFLDRDGVLNRSDVVDGKPYAPRRLENFDILPDVGPALKRLKSAGLVLSVVTNQPDVATGKQTPELISAMHSILREELPIDDIRACFHVNKDNCCCRKPKPGMLLASARELQIDLEQSFMIGDRASDVGAGNAVGCFTIFIDRGYREPAPTDADATVASMSKACDVILQVLGTGKN